MTRPYLEKLCPLDFTLLWSVCLTIKQLVPHLKVPMCQRAKDAPYLKETHLSTFIFSAMSGEQPYKVAMLVGC